MLRNENELSQENRQDVDLCKTFSQTEDAAMKSHISAGWPNLRQCPPSELSEKKKKKEDLPLLDATHCRVAKNDFPGRVRKRNPFEFDLQIVVNRTERQRRVHSLPLLSNQTVVPDRFYPRLVQHLLVLLSVVAQP